MGTILTILGVVVVVVLIRFGIGLIVFLATDKEKSHQSYWRL